MYSLWSLSTVAKGGLDWSTVQIGQVSLSQVTFKAGRFPVLEFANPHPPARPLSLDRTDSITFVHDAKVFNAFDISSVGSGNFGVAFDPVRM